MPSTVPFRSVFRTESKSAQFCLATLVLNLSRVAFLNTVPPSTILSGSESNVAAASDMARAILRMAGVARVASPVSAQNVHIASDSARTACVSVLADFDGLEAASAAALIAICRASPTSGGGT